MTEKSLDDMTALDAATLAKFSYRKDGQQPEAKYREWAADRITGLGFGTPFHEANADGQCFVLPQSNVVAIRGTDSFGDLVGDILAWPTKDRELQHPKGARFVRVHKGVMKGTQALRQFIHGSIEPDQPSTWIGHSFGGGVAVHAVVQLKEMGIIPRDVPVRIITFGGMRVGTKSSGFLQLISRNTIQHIRFVQRSDGVPHLPLALPMPIDFRHGEVTHGVQLNFFDGNLNYQKNAGRATRIAAFLMGMKSNTFKKGVATIGDHFMDGYIAAIKRNETENFNLLKM